MNSPKIVLFALNSSYVHTNPAVRLIKKYCDGVFAGQGLDIQIIECDPGCRDLDIIDTLCSQKADIYGFSVYIWNRDKMLLYAQTLKKLVPDCAVFMGGPEISYETQDFFTTWHCADAIIRGEGERATADLINDFVSGRKIEGFYDGKPLTSEELEKLGSPYSPNEDLSGKLVYLESSRGCPFSCSYCLSGNDTGLRFKSPDAFLDELEQLRNRGVATVKLLDRTFNCDRQRAREIIGKIIDRNFPFCCHFEMCAHLIEQDDIRLLSRAPAGKIRLECGVQTVNPDTLRAINRADNTEKILWAVNALHELPGITLHLDLIAGLPHETSDSFKQAYNLFFGKCDMLQVGFLKLLRGTPMRDGAEGYVYLEQPPYTVLQTPDMTRQQLSLWRDIAFLTDKYLNSDGFYNTFEHFFPADPFDFMCKLRETIIKREDGLNRQFTRAKLCRYLLDCLSLTNDRKEAASCLRLDFLLHENVLPPAFLAPDESEKPTHEDAELAQAFMSEKLRIPPSRRGLVYFGRFLHLKNRLTVCCRDTKEVYILDK